MSKPTPDPRNELRDAHLHAVESQALAAIYIAELACSGQTIPHSAIDGYRRAANAATVAYDAYLPGTR